MNRIHFCVAVLLTLCVAFPVQADVKTSEVTLQAGGEEFKAFVAEPEGPGPFPGIIVIQEWWGLNDWIKDNAKRFAAKGYVAVAPDLYHGKVTDDPKVAAQLRKGMPRDRALRDLKATGDFLASKNNVHKDKLGVIGWCMGGGYALEAALQDDRLRASVICYGAVVTDADRLKSLNATVLGIFGEEDRGIPVSSVRKFEEAMKEAGKKVDAIHIYKAGHGFMREVNNPAYRKEATEEAWKRIDEFFAQTLGGKA